MKLAAPNCGLRSDTPDALAPGEPLHAPAPQDMEAYHCRAIIESSDDAIISKTLDGRVISWNQGAEKVFGYRADEMLGRPLLQLFPPDRMDEERFILERLLLGETVEHFETVRLRKNGQTVQVSVTISPIRDQYGNIVGASKIARDISQRKLAEQRLEHVAHYDALTDLPNRLLLSDRLHQAMAGCLRKRQTLAVLYLDLDGFKTINDRFGHAAGDQLLVAVSARMKAALREVDTLARLGGDEFVALLVDVQSAHEWLPLVHRILKACSEPVWLEGQAVSVSTSIGLTLYPQDSADAVGLIRHADRAMYAAKQSGKNRYTLFDTN
jgi:diguanylate cyclase (GGDEF)-like protein/PAS domain S-box-containing protein